LPWWAAWPGAPLGRCPHPSPVARCLPRPVGRRPGPRILGRRV